MKKVFLLMVTIITITLVGCNENSNTSDPPLESLIGSPATTTEQPATTTEVPEASEPKTNTDDKKNETAATTIKPVLSISVEELHKLILEEEEAGILAVVERVIYQSQNAEEVIQRVLYLNDVIDLSTPKMPITDVSIYRNAEGLEKGTKIFEGDIVADTTIISVVGDGWTMDRVALPRTESNSVLDSPRIYK